MVLLELYSHCSPSSDLLHDDQHRASQVWQWKQAGGNRTPDTQVSRVRRLNQYYDYNEYFFL